MDQQHSTVPTKILIKLGGPFLNDEERCRVLFRDIADFIMHHSQVGVESQKRTQCVIVHGGGSQLTEFARTQSIQTHFDAKGNRITSGSMMRCADMILGGAINSALLRTALAAGLPAVGISASSANLIQGEYIAQSSTENTEQNTAKNPLKNTPENTEQNFSATIANCDLRILHSLVDGSLGDGDGSSVEGDGSLAKGGFIPIISSTCTTKNGTACNINADDVAMTLAREWNADIVLLLSDIEGVYDMSMTKLSSIAFSKLPALITRDYIRDGMKKKLTSIYNCITGIETNASRTMQIPKMPKKMIDAITIGTHKTHGDFESLLHSKIGTTINV